MPSCGVTVAASEATVRAPRCRHPKRAARRQSEALIPPGHGPSSDVVLSDFDIVEPDLTYLSRERWSVLTEANLRGAPDLVVEILSPSTAGRPRSGARWFGNEQPPSREHVLRVIGGSAG